MARIEKVELIDDLTQEAGDDVQAVEFALDGVAYRVDLNDGNAAELRDFLSTYTEAGTRLGKASTNGSGKGPSRNGGAPRASGVRYDRETSRHMREWGRQHGFEVNERGRVPNDLVEAWERAHQGQAA